MTPDADDTIPRLRLLGAVELLVRGQRLTQFGGPMCTMLLARLAIGQNKAHPREELIDQLWPAADLDAGRNRLRNALAVLRGELGRVGCAHLISANRISLRIATGAMLCDVRRFEEAISRKQWVSARDAYGGDLMPGFFDDWVDEERLRLLALVDRIPPDLPQPTPHHLEAIALINHAQLLARRGAPGLQARALALLEQAVAKAPDFGLAQVRLATTLHNMALSALGDERRGLIHRARVHIEKAIQLDPADAFARSVLVVQRYRVDLDLSQAVAALRELAERWPDAPAPWTGLTLVYNDVGHSEEAEACASKARAMLPMDVIQLYNIAVARANGYRFAEAVAAFDEVLELEPDHGISLVGKFYALAGCGRIADALAAAQVCERVKAIDAAQHAYFRGLCAHWSGQAAQARAIYAEPAVESLCRREPAYDAVRQVHLGRFDAALEIVQRMHDEADRNLLIVFGSRNGLDTRRDPRIEAIAARLGWRPIARMPAPPLANATNASIAHAA